LLSSGYGARDKTLNDIDGFWLVALKNNALLASLIVIEDDIKALKFLKCVRAWRDPEQISAFGFEFVSILIFGQMAQNLTLTSCPGNPISGSLDF
jgi:hypothetical protein